MSIFNLIWSIPSCLVPKSLHLCDFPHLGPILVSPSALPMFSPMAHYKLIVMYLHSDMLYVTYPLAICFANLTALHLSPWRVSPHPVAVSSFQCCWPPSLKALFPTQARGCIFTPSLSLQITFEAKKPWREPTAPPTFKFSPSFYLGFLISSTVD